MLFAAQAVLVNPASIQHPVIQRVVAVSLRMAAQRFFGDFGQADAFDGSGGAGEELFDEGG